MTKTMNIAKDFHSNPSGRTKIHGDWHGTKFREKHLIPHLEKSEELIVDLEGLVALSPSFFEESFGGLYRSQVLPTDIKKQLRHLITYENTGQGFRAKMWIRIKREIDRAESLFQRELP